MNQFQALNLERKITRGALRYSFAPEIMTQHPRQTQRVRLRFFAPF